MSQLQKFLLLEKSKSTTLKGLVWMFIGFWASNNGRILRYRFRDSIKRVNGLRQRKLSCGMGMS
jgi:hypothetical protein